MIDPKDISVVVQGPVVTDPEVATPTREVLASVRSALPGAELIYSTWENTDVAGLDFDHAVFSPDPGSAGERANTSSANIYRQIASSSAGLKAATRPHALKLRSDTSLTSSAFVRLWEEHAANGFRPSCFSKRILVSAIFTPCPRHCPSPYWVSDFFAFGLLEDVRNLWDLPSSFVDLTFQLSPPATVPQQGSGQAINAEQRLMIALANKNGINARARFITTVNPFVLAASEKFIASNFLPVDPVEAGFNLANRFHRFTDHHTYRFDHKGKLFRAEGPCGAAAAFSTGLAKIAVACAKGTAGRIRRKFKNPRP